MTGKTLVLKHINDIDVAVNEVVTSYSVNRNLRKLLENDVALNDLYVRVMGNLNILEYSDTRKAPYQYGDLVWFKYKAKLWLLKSIQDNNLNNPRVAIDDVDGYVNGNPNFERIGWEDQNEYVDIMAMGIERRLRQLVRGEMLAHSESPEYHRFGRLSLLPDDPDYIGNKVLRRDLSNADPARDQFFYPYQTGHFTTDSIVDGTYRIWDNGLLEMNIVFRVGRPAVGDDGLTHVRCNDIMFQQSSTRTKESMDYQENAKYFAETDDMSIFQNPAGMQTRSSKVNDVVFDGRNRYVNTYFAKLNLFPNVITLNGTSVNSFVDLNYMIFATNPVCLDDNHAQLTMHPGKNQMAWCDKLRDSVTAVYVTYPDDADDEDFAAKAGLAANSFSCSIVGRWKK